MIITLVLIVPILCHAFDKWPDTGQVLSYTDTAGEDADYIINPPSYTKLGAGGVALSDDATLENGWIMTRDNVTGLTWEVKNDEGFIHDKDNKYTWCDSNAGTNGGNPGTCGEGTDTEDFIYTLNNEKFGGYNDWRLPTIKEMCSIVKSGRHSPSINTTFFPNIGLSPDYYWSSTNYGSAFTAWQVYFYNFGFTSTTPKSNQGYAVAVRGPKSDDPVLADNGETVTDIKTGLMWFKASQRADDWESAIKYCETLSAAGHDDWRLPNRNELQSLIDYSKSKPAIDKVLFPDTNSASYWSSTTQAFLTTNAWLVDFTSGNVHYHDKSNDFYRYYVRAVRGGPPGSLDDSDNDGISDDKDQCSDTPEGATVYSNGCAVKKGDINNNGNLDLEDSQLGLKVITSHQNLADISTDVNMDGIIGLEDAIFVLQIVSNSREIPVDKTYKIGLSLALTGPTSETGIVYAKGIEDYFKLVNETKALGYDQIHCMISDDQYSLVKTNENFQNFLKENILVFLGYSTASMLDMKDDFESEKIPVISASLHADNLTGSNYIYLPMATYSEQVTALAEYIDSQHPEDTPKVALYVHPSAFGRGPVEALKSAVSAGLNIEIVETIEHGNDVDITEMLNRLDRKKVQYVICQSVQSPIADLLKEAASLGLTAAAFGEKGKITFLGAHYTGGADLISLTGSALLNYFWITSLIGTSQESEAKNRQLALAAKYNRSDETANSYFYSNGIMVAQLVVETIKRVKSKGIDVTREKLKNEMDLMNGENAFHPYTTVGPATFSVSDHSGVNTLQIYSIQNGVFKTFGEPFLSEFYGK